MGIPEWFYVFLSGISAGIGVFCVLLPFLLARRVVNRMTTMPE